MKSFKILFQLSIDKKENNRGIYNIILFMTSQFSPQIRIFPLLSENNGGKLAGIALYGSSAEVSRIANEIMEYLDDKSVKYELDESDLDVEGFEHSMTPVVDVNTSDEMEQMLAERSFGFGKLPHSLDEKELRAYNLWRNLRSGISFFQLKMPDDARRQLEKVIKEDPNNFEAHHHLGLVYEIMDDTQNAIDHFLKALESDPESGDTHFFLANTYQKTKDYDNAIEHYKQCIELDPDVPIVYNNLAWIFLHTERYEQAVRAFKRAINLDPELPFPYNGLGCVLQEKGMLEEAAEEFKKAIELYPQYTAAHLKLGWTYYLMRDYERALGEYTAVLKLTDDPAYLVKTHYSMGHTFLAVEDFPRAMEAFEKVIRMDNEFGDAYYQAGLIQLRQDRFSTAAESLKKAIELEPEINLDVYKNLAFACMRIGHYDEALKYCMKSLEVEPDDPEIFELIGGVYAKKDEWDLSVEYFLKAIGFNPNSSQAYFNLGWAYENVGLIDKSIEQYKKAIQLNPDSSESYSNLAWLYVKLEKPDEAIVLFEKALEIEPNDLNLLNNIGWFHTLLDNYEEALEYFKRALKLDPDNPFVHNNLGIIYLKQGDLDKAKSKLELALKLGDDGDNSAVSYYYLANVALKKGNLERALEFFQKSRELDPRNTEVFYQIGMIYLRMEKKRDANKAFRTYLKLDPHGKHIDRVKEMLKPIRKKKVAEES